MSKKKDLLSFLFLQSADADLAESERRELDIAENLEQLFEAAAEIEKGELESKKTPLAKALSEFGISDAELQLDPEGFVIVTDNHDKYVDMVTVLASAEAMHKLAEMGWVVTKPGDVAMTNEPAEYHLRFLEITTVEANDREPKPGYDDKNREAVIKKAQEFATTPMDRKDDKLNPVEQEDGKMGKKDASVGKAKDGEEPEKAIHDALARGDIDTVMEMTTTGSMGTSLSQGAPGAGLVKKPAPYGKGTPFKTPGQWTVKQPVVNAQVKRKVRSESEDAVENNAQNFLNEEGPFEDDEPGMTEDEYDPEAGDIGTEDHHTFYQYGKLWLETPSEMDWSQVAIAVRNKMEAENFSPNVYFISDHGNAHLITDLWPAQSAPAPESPLETERADFRERHAAGDQDAINQGEQ